MADDFVGNISAMKIFIQLCQDLGVKIVFDTV